MIKVVVGFDGRRGGYDALSLGRRLRRMLGGELLVIAVFPFDGDDIAGHAEPFAVGSRAAANAVLDDARGIVGRAEHPTFVAIPASSAATALHEVAEGEDAEVIVVGVSEDHGHRIPRASTTWGTLHHAPCAVAVAPRGWRDADRPLARIGIAYDGTPEARIALDAAAALVDQVHASIDWIEVVHVAASGGSGPLPLDDAATRLSAPKLVDRVELRGDPATKLVEHADDLDLLVLGSHDRGGLGRLLLGSVCRDVIEHVRTPVLVRPWRRPRGAAMLRAASFL